jgi:hypothetical protein
MESCSQFHNLVRGFINLTTVCGYRRKGQVRQGLQIALCLASSYLYTCSPIHFDYPWNSSPPIWKSKLLTASKSDTSALRWESSESWLNKKTKQKQTPWSESAKELYRPSDRSMSAKLVPTFSERGCHVVSLTDPYIRILGFIDRSR